MRRGDFEAWLSKQISSKSGKKLKYPETLVTDALAVDRYVGDLDAAFDRDGLGEFITKLTYGKADERAQKPNPTKIPYKNNAPANSPEYFHKLKDSLSASKSAVTKYRRFREADSPTNTSVFTATPLPTTTLTALDSHDGPLPDELPTDQRERTLAIVRLRRGQSTFRNALINKYGPSCMMSGCTIMDIVEASHIFPYNRGALNDPRNGLLLRSDLHTLFDIGLLGIDPTAATVKVAAARAA
jgi:hypothetical protein